MHLRQLEYHVGLCITAKLHQLFYYGFIIQVSKFFADEFSLCLNTWILIKVVVTAEIIFTQ